MLSLLRPAAVAAFVLAASLAASAQTVQVRGTVTDDDGPVRLARVTVQDADASGDTLAVAFTDASGDFSATIVATSGESTPEATAYDVGRPFPNPAGADRVTVLFTTPSGRPEPVQTRTYDLLGRQMTPGAPLPSGVYIVRLGFADGSVSRAQRFVVAQSGARVVAEHTAEPLGLPAQAPLAKAAPGAAPVVFVTVERAGYVTETQTVDAEGGADLSIALAAAAAPTAQIATPGTVQAGTALTLDGSASAGADGEPLAYSWAFGNGARGGTARVAHVYTEPGTYTVTLTVRGAFGATASTTAEVTVTDPPEAAGTTPVIVRIQGASGAPIAGAEVRVVGGAASATTNADGEATVEGVPTGVSVAFAVSQPGFATQRLALDLPTGLIEAPFYEVTLGVRQPAQTLRNAEQGGEVGGIEGVRVVLPVEGLVHADGTPASGDVEVRLTPVDVSDDVEIGVFPGEFAGITPDGEAPLIASYGVAEYVFEQSGEELTLAPGKTATIEIPIYVADDGRGTDLSPGDPFPLWSLDETTGTWVLEGEGIVVASGGSPTGLALRAEVTHFSWWNCDVAPNPLNVVPDITLDPGDGEPPTTFPTGTPVTISASSGEGPRTSATTTISSGDDTPLLAPPGVPIVVEAIAGGGLFEGEAMVTGEAGATVTLDIVLRRTDVSGGGGDIAADTTFTAAIDAVGEVDSYTFAAQPGRFVQLSVEATSAARGTLVLRAPDGSTVGSEAFRTGTAATIRFQPDQDGLYTVEVAETAGIVGTYSLSLFATAIQQAAIGVEQSVTIPDEGGLAAFAFEGTAGQPLDVYFGGESRRVVQATFFDPDGADGIAILGLRSNRYLELASSGSYVVLIEARTTGSGPVGEVSLSLRAVPTIQIGDQVTGALREGERHNYRFQAQAGDLVRTAATSDTGDPNAFVLSTFGSDTGQTPQPQAFGVNRLSAGAYRIEVSGGFSGTALAYTAALNDIAPATSATLLTFGTGGRAEVTGQIDQPGDLRLYRVQAPAGSGLFTALTASGADPLSVSASIAAAPLQAGEAFPNRNAEIEGFGTTARFNPEFDAAPEARPPGLLEAFGARLPEGESFIVAVGAGAIRGTNIEVGGEPTGSFAFRADLATPGAAIEVDDDLAQCPSADTRSLRAALFAAGDDTAVTVCAGRYAEATIVVAPEAPSVAGTSRDGVVIARTVLASNLLTMDVRNPDRNDRAVPSFRDLTIETNGQAARITGDDVTFERVAVRPGPAAGSQGIGGIQVDGSRASFDAFDIESDVVRFGITARVPFDGDGPTVTNSQFAGPAFSGMVTVQGQGATVTGNTFTLSGGAAVQLLGSQSGAHTVTGNTVTVASGGVIATGVINVSTRGAGAAESIVSDNRIETAQDAGSAALSLLADGSRIVADRNEVIVTSENGVQGLAAQTNRDGEIVVRSSVFSGIGLGTPVSLTVSGTGGPISFVNNSVSGTSSTSTNTRLVVVSGGSEANPITLVNNVLVASRGLGVDASGAATLVADHNLFFGFQNAYDTGLSGGSGDVIGQDPQFTNARLEVRAGSPAVDAGASAADFPDVPTTDLDGTARPQGAAVDIGAHEQ